MDEGTKRAVYVAITRAKQNLHIFCNGSYFDRINTDGVFRSTDETDYQEPSVISMQLSHRDVVLRYFAYRRNEIDNLLSGQELIITDAGCSAGDKQVLKFSTGCKAKIESLKEKGYMPVKAVIRHIVFWQDKDTDKESKIILPDLEIVKRV